MWKPLFSAVALVAAACTAPKAPEPVPAPGPAPAPKVTTPAPLNPEPTKARPIAKPTPPTVTVAPKPAESRSPPPPPPTTMDLKVLEQRLKGTDAIGVLTKLSLKNQVDDLVARFKAFHDGKRPPTLPELRPAFDLLVMKVLSLLQDKDPRLAADIHASRDALWNVLADRQKLQQASGE